MIQKVTELSVFRKEKLADVRMNLAVKIMKGMGLSKEEYYLALAYDMFTVEGVDCIEKYENFRLHFWENDKRMGWIQSSAETNREGHPGFGILPRFIPKAELTKEQIEHLTGYHEIPIEEIGMDADQK